MVRWKPGAADRLRSAALELFHERGFEQTTAADIAEAAGVTERTFFRHYSDKREVLFGGQDSLRQLFVDGVAGAPAEWSAAAIVEHVVQSIESYFDADHRSSSRVRQAVIDANPGLQERELLKMASLARATAVAFGERGVPEPQATLAAESGVTVFGVAYRQWIADEEESSFAAIVGEVFGELRAVTKG
ncbi:TetR family transcriptional regulator [Rhodococcoides trifolii]|nr:TetR family transcriptional regulator [Rhodococcus trifolii]